MKFTFSIGFLVLVLLTQGQTAQLSGYIQDAASGEMLPGATIWCAAESVGAGTNAFGFYSLSLPPGKQTLTVSYIGYAPAQVEVELLGDTRLDFPLQSGVALSEAIVLGEGDRIEDEVQMSKMEIPMDQIRRLPAIGGEVDLLKSLQLMPGVQSGGEGTSGLYVRGGSPDQNLIVLDGVPLYSVSHLFGFFSVFNADAVKRMTITKGGFPARFGGRLSSVVEVQMKEGNMRETHGTVNVSLLASKLMIEGPIVKDKASFMISGRRTYLDVLTRPIINAVNAEDPNVQTQPRYFFHDLNGKVNWRIGDRDRVYLSLFDGTDDFGFESTETFGESSSYIDFGLDWRNRVAALRWNREWGPKLFSNVTLTRSQYEFNTGVEFRESFGAVGDSNTTRLASLYQSGIVDLGGRIDFLYALNNRHSIRFGGNVTLHTFNPGATTFQATFEGSLSAIDTTLGADEVGSDEHFLFVEDEMRLHPNLKANVGLHAALLRVNGTNFASLQPRASLNYRLPDGSAVKASYARMNQFVHLLTNEGLALPTDLWVPATDRVTPQTSQQWALGWAKTYRGVEYSIEAYHKAMTGLLSYREGASFANTFNSDWEDQVTQGVGEAYGFEFLLQKKRGNTTGWIGYTLSWANRQFDEINSGNPFPYTYDRRHDASVVVMHTLSDRIDLSATWVYGTGRALTLPESVFRTFVPAAFTGADPNLSGTTVEVPGGKNEYRQSPYHRADVALTIRKEKKRYLRTTIISVYNVYNNLNPFFSLVDVNVDGSKVIREYGIFPIIPSIAWRIEF